MSVAVGCLFAKCVTKNREMVRIVQHTPTWSCRIATSQNRSRNAIITRLEAWFWLAKQRIEKPVSGSQRIWTIIFIVEGGGREKPHEDWYYSKNSSSFKVVNWRRWFGVITSVAKKKLIYPEKKPPRLASIISVEKGSFPEPRNREQTQATHATDTIAK